VGSSEDESVVGKFPCSSGIGREAKGNTATKRWAQRKILGVAGREKGVEDILVIGTSHFVGQPLGLLLSRTVVAVVLPAGQANRGG
jgi:hypothetical protein